MAMISRMLRSQGALRQAGIHFQRRTFAQKPDSNTISAASAQDFKLANPTRAPPPLVDPPRWTAEEAVNNILYNTPPPLSQPFKRHTLNCLVQNEPGVLARVSSCLAGRGFNIESLVVCATEVKDLSRMCIVLRGQDAVIEQARRQVEELVPVWAVLNYTDTPRLERELLLAKVSLVGPEHFDDLLTTAGTLRRADNADESPIDILASRARQAAQDLSPSVEFPSAVKGLSPSEILKERHVNLTNITNLASLFGGSIIDTSNEMAVVQLVAKTTRVDSFLKLVRPYGIVEAARSGVMVMPRAIITSSWKGVADDDNEVADIAEAIDNTLLPPG